MHHFIPIVYMIARDLGQLKGIFGTISVSVMIISEHGRNDNTESIKNLLQRY